MNYYRRVLNAFWVFFPYLNNFRGKDSPNPEKPSHYATITGMYQLY